MDKARERYPTMSKTDLRKHARQAARSVLPNCAETVMVFTCNARELRHIIALRGGAGAEIEIRRLAIKFLELMQKEAPNLFSDFKVEKGEDKIPVIITDNTVVTSCVCNTQRKVD